MREFTPEEKELILNTPITIDCFDIPKEDISCTTLNYISQLEQRRKEMLTGYQPRGIDTEFDILVRQLPSSYKVVNLCAERKDLCKGKHQVPETPHFARESRAVPCYTMYSCYSCALFKK
jgi:hypothetical protein